MNEPPGARQQVGHGGLRSQVANGITRNPGTRENSETLSVNTDRS